MGWIQILTRSRRQNDHFFNSLLVAYPRDLNRQDMGCDLRHDAIDTDRFIKRLEELTQFQDTQDTVLQDLRARVLLPLELQRQ